MDLFPSWVVASVALSPAASPPDGAAWPESKEPQTVNKSRLCFCVNCSVDLNLHSMIHFLHIKTCCWCFIIIIIITVWELQLIRCCTTFSSCKNERKNQTARCVFHGEGPIWDVKRFAKTVWQQSRGITQTLDAHSRVCSPGTAVKNFTASLWPWKESWAWAMEQYGTKVPGVTLSLFSSP